MSHTENIIRNLEAKLLRQEKVCEETREHIRILREREEHLKNKDQPQLPAIDTGKASKR